MAPLFPCVRKGSPVLILLWLSLPSGRDSLRHVVRAGGDKGLGAKVDRHAVDPDRQVRTFRVSDGEAEGQVLAVGWHDARDVVVGFGASAMGSLDWDWEWGNIFIAKSNY